MPTLFEDAHHDDDPALRSFHLKRRSIARLFAIANAVALLGGCGSGQRLADPVNAELARKSLTTVLDAWKNGEGPETLQRAVPPIVVQDLDWTSGFALNSYVIEGEGEFDDANLRVPVALKLKSPAGKAVERRASYVVGTSPSITVFREFR